MQGSKGGHRPRSKRNHAQRAEPSQPHGSSAQPPHGGVPLAPPRHRQRPQMLHLWVPVLPLQPGAGLPRPPGVQMGGYPAHRGRAARSAHPTSAGHRSAEGHQSPLTTSPEPACQSDTAADAAAPGDGAPSPRGSSCWRRSHSAGSQPEATAPSSSSSGTTYADASSGEHRLQGASSQAAAQAAPESARELLGRMRAADPAWGVDPRRALPRAERFRGQLTYAQLLQLYGRKGTSSSQGGQRPQDGREGDVAHVPEGTNAGGSSSGDFSLAAPQLNWEWMLDGVLGEIINKLDPLSVQRFRLVCRQWRGAVGRNLSHLQPSAPKLHRFVLMFPSLQGIDLSGCSDMRNRSLELLAHSGLKLRALVVGHNSMLAHNRPRITNLGLAAIAQLTTLTRLSLSDCGAITGNGLAALSTLTRLQALSVTRCARITDAGIEPLMALPRLAYLDVYGSVKVGDRMVAALVAAAGRSGRAPVLQLHLGFTRISNAGVKGLAGFPSLIAFSCEGELISEGAIQVLSALTGLQHLGLSNTALCGDALLALVGCLPELRHLDLRNSQLSDEHLMELPQAVRGLTRLLISGTMVGEPGLRALTGLRSLRWLCFEASSAALAPCCISALTSLTSLQVQGISQGLQVLSAVSQLPCLRRLALSDFNSSRLLFPAQTLNPLEALLQLSHCKSLTDLELLHMSIRPEQIQQVVACVPSLQRLRVHGCPLTVAELAPTAERHPQLRIIRRAPTRLY